METLDKCFENVCELDLIFHMDKVGKKENSDLINVLLIKDFKVLCILCTAECKYFTVFF